MPDGLSACQPRVMRYSFYMRFSKYADICLFLCVIAGVLYNSWPLGYVLDAGTAHSELASSLERAGHPYYWVFLLGDLLTALCVLLAAAVIRFRLWRSLHSRTWAVTSAGMAVFGVFTVVSALAPAGCAVEPALKCGTAGVGLGLDAFASTIAALGLLAGLISLSARGIRRTEDRGLAAITLGALGAWSAVSVAFVVLALSGGNPNVMEYIQLILSGLALVVLGLNARAGSSGR